MTLADATRGRRHVYSRPQRSGTPFSANGKESKDPFLAILRNAAALVKALETGRVRGSRGYLAHDSSAGTVVTMDRIGIGAVGGKSGSGKGDDGEQRLHSSVLFGSAGEQFLPALTLRCAICAHYTAREIFGLNVREVS
jgi:hypothetical protein